MGCTGQKELPESFGSLSSIRQLDLTCCQELGRLPDRFGGLSSLCKLKLAENRPMRILPTLFDTLGSLRRLQLSGFYTLKRLPDPPTMQLGGVGDELGQSTQPVPAGHDWTSVPDSFASLRNLEILSFGSVSRIGVPS